MNNRMKGLIELAKQDFAQAMELIAYMPGAKEAILKHTHPKANPQHRKFFRDAAKDPQTDPETLHTIGIRDLPTKIRYAVIDNPSTQRETIEKMARQSANDAVRFRAQKFLETNSEPPEGDIMESKFKLSTKDIRRIIKEELNSVLKEMRYPSGHPDNKFLRNIRRQDAGLDPKTIAAIKKLEKTDLKMARELAASMGSKENLEIMPDDPQNVMALKSEILRIHGIIIDHIFFTTAEEGEEDIDWEKIGALRKKRNELEDQLTKITGESGDALEDWRNETYSDRKKKLKGVRMDNF